MQAVTLSKLLIECSPREQKGYEINEERLMANLVLFFCASRGGKVNGALVGIDGTCVSL